LPSEKGCLLGGKREVEVDEPGNTAQHHIGRSDVQVHDVAIPQIVKGRRQPQPHIQGAIKAELAFPRKYDVQGLAGQHLKGYARTGTIQICEVTADYERMP
jgi:hypothetical protein